jgi:hypothetical protein
VRFHLLSLDPLTDVQLRKTSRYLADFLTIYINDVSKSTCEGSLSDGVCRLDKRLAYFKFGKFLLIDFI